MADTIITATVGTGTQYQVGGTGNVYYFNGAQPTDFKFAWVAGAVLRVDQSDATNDNHPFLFTTSASTNTATMRAGIITNNVEYYLDGAASQADYMNTSTFNAATNRWIEITITAPSVTDFFFACWVHGISMGGIIDLTQTTWGAMNWGQGAWNQQGDEAVSLTGLQMTGSLNAAGVDVEQFPGWGTLEWGENSWGDVTGTAETLPSFLATASLGSLSTDVRTDVALTGLEITGALGTPALKFDFELILTDSLLATATLGQLGINAGDDVQVGLASLLATGSVGAIDPADVVGLTGLEITGRVGNLQEGILTIVDLQGTSLLATGAVGAITPFNSTGVTITDSLLATGTLNAAGVITPDQVIGLTGYEITGSINAADIWASGYADVDITGNTSYTPVKHVNQP
jgi:hypothetical protein